jgi:hypothetical protein
MKKCRLHSSAEPGQKREQGAGRLGGGRREEGLFGKNRQFGDGNQIAAQWRRDTCLYDIDQRLLLPPDMRCWLTWRCSFWT